MDQQGDKTNRIIEYINVVTSKLNDVYNEQITSLKNIITANDDKTNKILRALYDSSDKPIISGIVAITKRVHEINGELIQIKNSIMDIKAYQQELNIMIEKNHKEVMEYLKEQKNIETNTIYNKGTFCSEDIYNMHYVEGKSWASIAKMDGRSESAIRSAAYKFRDEQRR